MEKPWRVKAVVWMFIKRLISWIFLCIPLSLFGTALIWFFAFIFKTSIPLSETLRSGFILCLILAEGKILLEIIALFFPMYFFVNRFKASWEDILEAFEYDLKKEDSKDWTPEQFHQWLERKRGIARLADHLMESVMRRRGFM